MGINTPANERFGVQRLFYSLESLERLLADIGPGGDARFRPLSKGTEETESSGFCHVPFFPGPEACKGLIAFAFRTDKVVHDKAQRAMLMWEKERDQGTTEETVEQRRLRWSTEVDRELNENQFAPKTTLTVIVLQPFGEEMSDLEKSAVESRGYHGRAWVFSASDQVLKAVMQSSGKIGLHLEYSAPWVVKQLEEPKAMLGRKQRGSKSFYGPLFFGALIKKGEFELDPGKINARLVRPTTFDIERISLARDAHSDFMDYLERGADPEAVGLVYDVYTFNPQCYTLALKSLQVAGATTVMPGRLAEVVTGCMKLYNWFDERFEELHEGGELSRYAIEEGRLEKVEPIFKKFGIDPKPSQQKAFQGALSKAGLTLAQYGAAAVIISREKERKDKK